MRGEPNPEDGPIFMDIQVSAKAVAAVEAQQEDQEAFAPFKADEEAYHSERSHHSGNSRHSGHSKLSNHSKRSHHSKRSGRVGHATHVVLKKMHSGVTAMSHATHSGKGALQNKIHSGVAAASHVTHTGKNVVQKGVHSGVAVAGGAAHALKNKVHSGGGHHHGHSNQDESNRSAS